MGTAIERSTLARRLAGHAIADEVLLRCREGETPRALADWLQEDLLLFTEAGREELEIAVKELFLTEVPLEERLSIQREGRSALAKLAAKQRVKRSAKQRLELLADIQQGRLEMLHEREAQTGSLEGLGANEIEIQRRIITDLHKISKDSGDDGQPQGAMSGIENKIGRALLSLMRERERVEIESEPKHDIEDAEFVEVGP